MKFADQVLPTVKKVVYGVDFKRVFKSKLVLGIADAGWKLTENAYIRPRTCGLDCSSRKRPDRPKDAPALAVSMPERKSDASCRRHGDGIVSSIGNSTQEVLASLHEAKSGITAFESFKEHGFRCQVAGSPVIDVEPLVDRRAMRFHGGGTAWNHIAMDQAIRDSGLQPEEVSHERTGIIMGSGGPSTRAIVEAVDKAREHGSSKRVGPFAVPKAMSSTASATLATHFKIKGVNYSISSACATSNHCIGNAYEMIQYGKQDVVFAGGCEELDWSLSVLFDAMGAMSSGYNDRASSASAPMTRTATASSSPAVPVWSCWKSMSGRRRVARVSTPRSSAMARHRTAMTWSLPRAKARSAACARRSPQ